MRKDEESTVAQYRRLLGQHGLSYKALNWGSRESQLLRFKILSEIGDLNGNEVLDVGCGLGDFAAWLVENKKDVRYTGLDLTPELVEQARKTHPSLRFVEGSILDESVLAQEQFDFVLASGIFTTYKEDASRSLEAAIGRMWALCKYGVAFNTLSAWAASKDADEYYADPLEVLAICRKLSPWLVLRHDYHPRDLTVYVLRAPGK